MKRGWAAVILALLAGCAGVAGGTRPGADAPAVASAYQQCRTIAASAVRTEAGVDQDILASRRRDWQRGPVGRVQTRTVQQQTSGREAAIFDACMAGKGVAPASR
jgi:hypothetical protein